MKTMLKRSIKQNLRLKNFEVRSGNHEKNTLSSRDETTWTWDSKRSLAMEN